MFRNDSRVSLQRFCPSWGGGAKCSCIAVAKLLRWGAVVTDDDRPHSETWLWPDEKTGPLRLRIWFGRVDGRSAVVGVELWGMEPVTAPWPPSTIEAPDAPIRAQDIRLPLGQLLEARIEMEYARARASRALWGHVPGHDETVRKFEDRLDSGHRPAGRPPLSDEMLRRVTDVYNAAVRIGDRAPDLRVFEELGQVFGASVPDTARGWVSRARSRGFPVLPPPGRKGRPARQRHDNEENTK